MSTLFVTCKHPPLSICLFPKDSEAGAEEEEVEEEEEEEGGSGMGWKQTKGWVGGWVGGGVQSTCRRTGRARMHGHRSDVADTTGVKAKELCLHCPSWSSRARPFGKS